MYFVFAAHFYFLVELVLMHLDPNLCRRNVRKFNNLKPQTLTAEGFETSEIIGTRILSPIELQEPVQL